MAGLAPEVPRSLAGRYRLVRLLARGGMAEVWEGQDDVLSRPVAVKVLFPHLAADPSLRERFRREAVTAARLVHPGIVAIFDAGVEVISGNGATPGTVLSTGWSRDEQERLQMVWPEQPSTAFIVMELVPGETLKDLIARSGPMSPSLVVAIASQVTDALAHAHAQGLVHRDIKPANVLLRDEGPGLVRVKVADFGIATVATSSNDLTATGALLGTPKYISPEQVEGKEPDARADLYSLGVVMFEMLAGHPPFKAPSDMATALAHVQQPVPDLSAERPSLPPELVSLVSGLLVKDRDHRIGSALELAGALQTVRSRLGLPSSEPGANLRVAGPKAGAPQGTSVPAGSPAAVAAPAQDLKGHEPKARAHGNGRAQPAGAPGTRGAKGPVHGGARSMQSRPSPGGDRTLLDGRSALPSQPVRRRRARTGSVVVLVILLAGAAVAAAVLMTGARRNGHSPGQSQASSKGVTSTATLPGGALKVVGVSELTQNRLLPDHPSMLPNLVSASSTGDWTSYIYRGPDFGGYGGLGLVFKMSGDPVVHSVRVTTATSGWSAEVFTGTTDATTLSGWGTAVARQDDIPGSATFSLGSKKARWVLLWMLDPGPTRQITLDKVVFR